MQPNEDLADLFKSERARMKLSLRSAAQLLGTGYGHLCQIERRQHVNVTIKTLSNAQMVFKVSTRRLWAAACRSLETVE